MTAPRQLATMLLAFVLGSGVAALLGAINSGVAFSVGTLCFAAAVVALILTE